MNITGSSNWKFNKDVVPVFDKHISQSVPMYEEIHSLIKDIAAWFLIDGTNVYDIGTSTGTVLINLTEAYPEKRINYYGLDSSDEMVDVAQSSFRNHQFVEIVKADVTDSKVVFKNSSLITSVLTMQFIPKHKRMDVFQKIYDGLIDGGAFVLVEKIIGNNARFNEMWTELYHELKVKNGLTEKHVLDKARAIRGVLQPYTLEENLEALNKVGFKDVDVFFKWSNFVGIVTVK